jgi:hypothetical protein
VRFGYHVEMPGVLNYRLALPAHIENMLLQLSCWKKIIFAH